MSSPSKEDTFAKGLVECRLKGSICRWRLPASINLGDLSKKFCLEFDDLRPFAVWVPSDLADHFVKMMNDKLHQTEPGRSRCVKTKKGVVLFGPPLRSGGEDEDATGGPASSDSRDRCIHGLQSAMSSGNQSAEWMYEQSGEWWPFDSLNPEWRDQVEAAFQQWLLTPEEYYW